MTVEIPFEVKNLRKGISHLELPLPERADHHFEIGLRIGELSPGNDHNDMLM